MAEITRRRTGEFLRELLSSLMAAPEGLRASDALHVLAGRFTLTPFLAPGGQLVDGRCQLPAPPASATVAVKIIGMPGEELIITMAA